MGPIWLLNLVGKKAAGMNGTFETGLGEENAGLVNGCVGEKGAGHRGGTMQYAGNMAEATGRRMGIEKNDGFVHVSAEIAFKGRC